ncbi:hypothetical protein PUN28_017419 [Cardiocondyla obscurior]|uniref:Uncharacterized protein n=1 Tax=Cardiocondyla obscurior TaxID=286306 RepID=A0AAW2EQF6_9HYME
MRLYTSHHSPFVPARLTLDSYLPRSLFFFFPYSHCRPRLPTARPSSSNSTPRNALCRESFSRQNKWLELSYSLTGKITYIIAAICRNTRLLTREITTERATKKREKRNKLINFTITDFTCTSRLSDLWNVTVVLFSSIFFSFLFSIAYRRVFDNYRFAALVD